MKTSYTLTTLAIVAFAAYEAGTTAPQIEADQAGTTEVATADTERVNVYLVDQVIYSEEPLSDAELLEALSDATQVTHDLIVDGGGVGSG